MQKSWEAARAPVRNRHTRAPAAAAARDASSGCPVSAGKKPSTRRDDEFFMTDVRAVLLPSSATRGASQNRQQKEEREHTARHPSRNFACVPDQHENGTQNE